MKNKKTNLRIDNLPLRRLGNDALLLVAGGQPHDCQTGSGPTCDIDDCGAIPVGSKCPQQEK